MQVTIALTLAALAAALVPGGLLQLDGSGDAWRVVTCHFTHWTFDQLLWDLIAFAGLAAACERRHRPALLATLAASAGAIPLALHFTDLTAYRGLSGIDSALFALLAVLVMREGDRRTRVVVLSAAALFFTKLIGEAITGSAFFATNLGHGVVPVPVAHLTGAAIGAAIGGAIGVTPSGSEGPGRAGESARSIATRCAPPTPPGPSLPLGVT